ACKLVGPAGEVEIPVGVIAAKRHIHLTPADAEEFGVSDKEIVSVKIDSNGRSTTFGDVVVRVSPKFAAAMHIDTDESNAACAFGECYSEIIK
ncbi:PduL/EutD family phosphate acyltransferase, partial [Vibrio sp. FNV 38]|nr:PduL/EutD family phosphate acyltransferase [Vibrio sp. FNV 38]